MEFWGIEIKPGSPLKVEPEDGYMIHVSQVSLGESNEVKNETVHVYVKVSRPNFQHKKYTCTH
ncbi:unnamed protein product [Arabis nemorensis]|uniref:Nucleoplasmin-like domain-containing protein n=1 Tax=Arabis nemorensis TaxID=586526 RepID=A0A565CT22_9BRAS|nr:unnamed protein product [Arabis nemorensis]